MRFGNWHPINGFLFLAMVISGTIFSKHPLLLAASFFSASIYIIRHKGMGQWLKGLRVFLPILIFFSGFNLLFNHQGVTVIGYVRENPVTFESLFYGLATGFMVSASILWFDVFHEFMGSDKWTYLFGNVIPTISLILSMALRMTPRFLVRAKWIRDARKGLGASCHGNRECEDEKRVFGKKKKRKKEGVRERFRNATRILYGLTAWSLEDAMETAISMKSRGYGLKKRTSYSNYQMGAMDAYILILLLGFMIILFLGVQRGYMDMLYFPEILFPKVDVCAILFYTVFFIILNTLILSDVVEGLKWRYIRSKI